ncbi:MAG TPA: hypothetical protein DD491_05545 [Halieaceae bacterium]|nr:hypothetical protein [Halieaceae bacterium]
MSYRPPRIVIAPAAHLLDDLTDTLSLLDRDRDPSLALLRFGAIGNTAARLRAFLTPATAPCASALADRAATRLLALADRLGPAWTPPAGRTVTAPATHLLGLLREEAACLQAEADAGRRLGHLYALGNTATRLAGLLAREDAASPVGARSG